MRPSPTTIAALLLTALLLAACSSDITKPEAPERAPLAAVTACPGAFPHGSRPSAKTLLDRLEYATADETGMLLRRSDSFTRQVSVFDRGARMRTLAPTTAQDFLAFLSRHGQEWTPDEQAYWWGIAGEVSAAVEGLNIRIPRIRLATTTGLEEFNAVYTRHNTIFFPRERLALAGTNRGWDRHLFAHELFHILSINNPATRDAIYRLLGFETFGGLEYPEELEARRITNPNGSGHSYEHYLTVQTPDGPADVVPVIQSSAPLEVIIQLPTGGPPAVFAYFDIRLVPVDTRTRDARRDDAGDLVTYGFGDTNWLSLMTRNSDYVIHPDELMADNFAHVVNWRLTGVLPTASWRGFPVNDPALLAAMQDVLIAGCDR